MDDTQFLRGYRVLIDSSGLGYEGVDRLREELKRMTAHRSAWNELSAIHAIRRGAVLWEQGSEDTCLIDIPPYQQVVITSDQINERQAYPGEDIRSLVRRGVVEAISDVAAAGAEVLGIQIDVRAPDEYEETDFEAIGLGIHDVLSHTGGLLLQASNMSRGEFGISTTVVGTVERDTALRRGGARPGQIIMLSGPVGGWDAALSLLNAGVADELSDDEWRTISEAFLNYRPEIQLGRALRRTGLISACIDANDCLAKTCRDLGDASGVGISVDTALIPVATAAKIAGKYLGVDPLSFALDGMVGDDRLLFTLCPESIGPVMETTRAISPQMAMIGEITEARGQVSYAGGVEPKPETGNRPTTIYGQNFATSRPLGVPGYSQAGRSLGPSRRHFA